MLLENASVPTPIFPNAKCVALPCFKTLPLLSLLYLPLILGPSITSVILDTDGLMLEKMDSPGNWYLNGDARQWDVVESALLGVAPQLHDFSIRLPAPEEMVMNRRLEIPQVDSIVRHLSVALTEIYISSVLVSQATIVALGSLPVLSSFEVALGARNDRRGEAQQPLTLPFASLTTLLVVFEDELDRSDFLSSVEAPLLQELTVIFGMLFDHEGHEEIVPDHILGSFFQCNRDSLTEFAMHSESTNIIDWAMLNIRVTTRTLQLLSRCQNLTKITVDLVSSREKDVGDDDLVQAFSCWPKLEVFFCRFSGYHPETPAFTARGVFEATKACPHLFSLHLSCDFRVIPDMTQDHEPNHVLKAWQVDSSPIECSTAVASWLERHFPELEDLDYSRFPRTYLLDAASKGQDIWPTHKEPLIVLTSWIQVERKVRQGEGCRVGGDTRCHT
jgi:hypothetical protein